MTSKQEYLTETIGVPVHARWLKLKGKIFNCHMEHTKILENYQNLISHRIYPERLDNFLILANEELAAGEKY
ncbi:MAG: hypothetical protein ACD_7C00316G0002 [uncultured bacterium]|nr:MAG: hypothetical protein ACD_7C00316G0002 [uncultured bacterium]